MKVVSNEHEVPGNTQFCTCGLQIVCELQGDNFLLCILLHASRSIHAHYMHVFMQCLVGIECTVYICMVGGALGGN